MGGFMSGRLRVAIIAGFSVFIFSIAAADVPPLINFQCKLTDTLGFSVEDSNYQLSFSIWDSSTSGIQKWSENQTVTVKGGLFNVLLGSINPIPDTVFNSPSKWDFDVAMGDAMRCGAIVEVGCGPGVFLDR